MFLENKELDKHVPIPLYFQLKELIVEEIKSGKYEVDSLIPTEKEMSERFDISRTTVRQAITELVQEGWLYRVKSKGTFIARQKIKQDFLQRLETFAEQMNRIGMEPSTEVIDYKTTRASKEVAENLQLQEGDQVLLLLRRRFGDKEPVVTVETYLPFDKCSFVQDYDFSKLSLYDSLSARDETRIYSATRVIEAVEATSRDAQYLHIRKGAPVQLAYTVGFNKDNVPLEYSIARYRGDMSSFRINVYVDTQ
ncbi:MAG: GntR family transcriptional regulator [Lachnospiraceae bacterium]|nr:GntR family transcriptional regulator [Lachnospiraceae bacterium]